MKSILVLEDEAYIGEWFYQTITALGYKCADCVSTVEKAINILSQEKLPDVVLIDLHLKGGNSGFDIAAYIDEKKLDIPYIITTAYKDIATLEKAKSYTPAAYLVKPFSKDNLFVAIEMAFGNKRNDIDGNKDAEIFIRNGIKTEKINLEDILILHSRGKYVEVVFCDTRKLIRSSLSAFVDTYNSNNWLRVHKSYIVNKAHIKEINREYVFVNKIKIPVGRNYQALIKSEFNLS